MILRRIPFIVSRTFRYIGLLLATLAIALLSQALFPSFSGAKSPPHPLALSVFSADGKAVDPPTEFVDIGQLDATPSPQTFTASLEPLAPEEFYRFDIQARSQFDLKLTGLTANANVFLGNEHGTLVASSKQGGTAAELIQTPLDPGTYYILVRSVGENSTPYDLTLSARFIPEEVTVSNTFVSIIDPEFDQVDFQVAWSDNRENLRVAPINPETGDFELDQTMVVDHGLAPVDCSNREPKGICNGPEWAYSRNGSQIVYTKVIDGEWFLARAGRVRDQWRTEVLERSRTGRTPFGSLDPEDDAPRIRFNFSSDNSRTRPTAWRELDDATQQGLVAEGFEVSGGRWVQGERSLILNARFDDQFQIAKFDIDTGILTQLTFSESTKGDAFMWQAPEFNGELIFSTLETEGTNLQSFRQTVGIYRNINGTWQKIKTIQPPSDKRALNSVENFVFQGKSYVSMVAIEPSLPTGSYRDRFIGAEVWIAGIDPEFDFYRQVTAPSDTIIRDDPEPFVGTSKVFIYYADLTHRTIIRRAETGL